MKLIGREGCIDTKARGRTDRRKESRCCFEGLFLFKGIARRGPTLLYPCESDGDGKLEEKKAGGKKYPTAMGVHDRTKEGGKGGSKGERVEAWDGLESCKRGGDPEFPASLVGKGRKERAVLDDDLALLQSGKDRGFDMLAAVFEEESKLVDGVQSALLCGLSDHPTVRAVCRFEGQEDFEAARAQGLGEKASLGGFARTIDAFKDKVPSEGRQGYCDPRKVCVGEQARGGRRRRKGRRGGGRRISGHVVRGSSGYQRYAWR